MLVTNSTSPDDITVQLVADNSHFYTKSMMELFTILLEQSDDQVKCYKPSRVGEFVGAPFEGSPYRTQVKAIHHDKQTAELLFLEFGNVEEVCH